MWNSESVSGSAAPQREVIVKSPEPSTISWSSFSIVLISSWLAPRAIIAPGLRTVTVPPLSIAVPSSTDQLGASAPSSNSSTKSKTPSAEPNSLPSIAKRSHDELKVSAGADAGTRAARAKAATRIEGRRNVERMASFGRAGSFGGIRPPALDRQQDSRRVHGLNDLGPARLALT